MKIFERTLKKIRSNRKWFMGTMATLVTALVVIVITIALLPEVKASAIEDDPVNKTMTYNIPQIVSEYNGASGLCVINIDVTDPEYKYYIVGDANYYNDVSIVVNYELTTSKEVPIYLDRVRINMTKDAPILKFTPSTNDNLNTNGSYKVIVKGPCSFISQCSDAKYPVVQVESISTRLYQLKAYYGDDINNPNNWYDVVSSDFATNVEFTSYEFSEGENRAECALSIVTALNSTGAGIGTTSGTIDMTAENVVLSDGSGKVVPDLADGSLSKIFGNRPLKVGVQALYGSSGFAGNVTVSGALKLTISANGYGACIGGGGNEYLGYNPKDGGSVTINGGTIYLATTEVSTNVGNCRVPAIGGGVDRNTGAYGGYEQVVINGGSLYVEDNPVAFGAQEVEPVNSNGDKLYEYETNYIEDIDPDTGKLLIASERYEDKHYADITVSQGYADMVYEYTTSDYSLLTYTYKGYGYGETGGAGENLYFWLPATPLCSLTFDESCYLEDDIPTIEMESKGEALTMEDGAFWLYGEGTVRLKNIPSFISIESVVLKDVRTGIATDYTAALQYDTETGDYTMDVNVFSNSTISITYSSDIIIDYNYNFVEGDTHNVMNTSPIEFEMGDELILDDAMVTADDLVFAGWYSDITGGRITNINDSNVDGLMDGLGRVKLNAKWKVKVKYDFGEGTGEEIAEELVPYNEESQITLSTTQPTLKYFMFAGWNVDGQIYNGGDTCIVKPIGDVVITATYMKNSYFVYIDATPTKFNIENVDIWVGLQGSPVTEENNRVIKNADGSYATKEINGVPYYQAVVDDAAKVAIILTPNPGRIISGQNVIVTEGKGDQMVFGAAGSQDGGITVQLTIDEDDIYISTNSEFALRDYKITFFDGMSANGGEQLWADEAFTYTINELDKTIGEILGARMDDIAAKNNRFFIFKGWMDKLTGKVYTNEDSLKENMGDMILVAQWDEINKYPINMQVVDTATGEEAKEVFAIPYYVNDDGSLEQMYTENEVLYAKANDRIKVVLYYYDNSGAAKELTQGVVLENIQVKYTKTNGNSASEETGKGSNVFCAPEVMAGTDVEVIANISVEKYNIIYWDTKGLENKNPTSYTFFDEVEIAELTENVGWLLVAADKDESNYDDIVTRPITKINRGTVGNLVLKADWADYSEKTYKVQIDTLIKNGKLEIIYPIGREEYIPNETLVIKVTPNPGYKLKNNVITYREMEDVSLYTPLLTTFGLRQNTVMYGVVEVTGDDGIYLVDMPDKDIIITAVFEEAVVVPDDGTEETTDGKEETTKPEEETTDGEEETTKPEEETTDKPEEETTTKDDTVDKEEETTEPKVNINLDVNKDNDAREETKKPHLVGGGNAYGSETYTGDTSNVTRLVLICVAAVIVLLILVLSKGEKKEEEKEENNTEKTPNPKI